MGVDVQSSFPAPQLPKTPVVAIVVSRNRHEQLVQTIQVLECQSCVASIIIIDSSNDADIAEKYRGLAQITVLRSAVNLGGAGSFAFGLLGAIAAGAEWIWLMDDDGRPSDPCVLQKLLAEAETRGLNAIAPAVLDSADPERFAFPYPINGRYVFTRADLPAGAFIPSMAHLFNGLLIRADAIFKTGLPDLRLFIRGDEIDFMMRMKRAGLRFGTTTAAAFLHPSSSHELFPIWGGRLHIVYPQEAWKRRSQYRNRGYNFWRHRLYFNVVIDLVRYPYFFLICRRFDLAGLAEWLSCSWKGVTGRVQVDPAIDLKPQGIK